MKTQTQIAKEAGAAQPTVANIIGGRRRPSWKLAKRLASVTGTEIDLWMEGSPEQIRRALNGQDVQRSCECTND